MKIFFLSLFFLMMTGRVFCQVPEKIVAALDSFSFIRPQEKTYLQTDRNSYLSGDVIWFKAYVLLNGKPTVLSKVVYVELVDTKGKILQKKMLKLIKGMAKGDMEIDKELQQDNYYLRCYTMWMLNFPSFITEKQIVVASNNATKQGTGKLLNPGLNVGFFPEAGNLVQGLKSVIAFKATDQLGRPVEVNGNVFNSKNEKVTAFTTVHDGMGSFELTPAANESYNAVIQFGTARPMSFALPASKAEGITLSVDNSNPGKTFARIERAEKNGAQYNELIVMAQLNYQVVYMAKLNIDEGQDAFAINKKNLPPGIMQVAVLSASGVPLAERLVFVANHKTDNLLLKTDTVNTGKRKKNVISFNASEFTDLQAAASIVNADADIVKYGPGIQSTLLLSSDLKGNINEPGYYFKDQLPETLKQLDLLMLVNGWRRYKLDEMIAGKYSPLSYPFETGLSITGKVLQSNGKDPLKSGKINMVIKGEDSTSIMAEAKTNPSSVFIIDNIDFRKEATFYYQGTNNERANAIVSVKIDQPYFDTVKQVNLNYAVTLNADADNGLLNSWLEERKYSDSISRKMLKGVTVTAKKRSAADSLNKLYASDLFFDSDQTLAVDESVHYTDIWRYLQANVAGISVTNTDTGTQVFFNRFMGTGFFSEVEGGNNVQFFLNEVPVSADVIDNVDITDIGLVKVFKDNTAIALGAIRGAIAVYTLKGKTGRDWRQKGFDFVKRPGYSVSREFYGMDYSRLNRESLFSDIRPTIYWNPELKLKEGKGLIEFYNDDICKKFKIIIEGIDANGKLLHLEKLVE